MNYGVPIYRQCAHCGYAIEIHPLIEGNHDGSVLWSDGFIESSTMPEQAILAACGQCAEVVWLTDLAPVDDPDADRVVGYRKLTAEDYLALVENSVSLDVQHTVVLRTLAWQTSNHARRGKQVTKAYSDAEQENMRELDALLVSEKENELFMKIEIARELGDFDKAEGLMRNVNFSPHIIRLTSQLKHWIAGKDSKVRVFKTHGLAPM